MAIPITGRLELQTDSHARVPDEAAETLGNDSKLPAVLLALRHAAEHDLAEQVRRKALRSIPRSGRRK